MFGVGRRSFYPGFNYGRGFSGSGFFLPFTLGAITGTILRPPYYPYYPPYPYYPYYYY